MINDLFAQVPWLKPFLAWAIAIGVAILILGACPRNAISTGFIEHDRPIMFYG